VVSRFLAIAYGLSWAIAAVLWATGGIGGLRHVVGGFAFMLGPAVAALVMTPKDRRREVFALKPKLDRWLFTSWALPAAVVVVATLLSALLPGVRLLSPADALATQVPPEQLGKLAAMPKGLVSAVLVVQALVMGPVLNVPFMLSEELGWRGTLWAQWKHLGFWRHALVTGAVWGVWHAPLIAMGHNYPGEPRLGIALMVVFCVLLTPALHHLRERGGTIWHACLFHGTINAGASLGAICIQTENWVGRGLVGLPGFAVLAACVLGVALVRRREVS
jgi:hypothetical protein